MGTGYDSDVNSMYGHLIRLTDYWVMEFSWKRRTSDTSGDQIWMEYAYRKVGTDVWLNKVDYLMYRLMQD